MLRYAITDSASVSGDEQTRQTALLRQATALASRGIDFLQLREKDLPAGDTATLTRKLLTILRPAGTKLLLNSRADIALATGADGVHLTSAPGSLTPPQIRQLYTAVSLPGPIVSISCHTLDDVVRARDHNATLILFGPVFEKRVGHALIAGGTGLELLRAACLAAGATPVLGLGGITLENTEACLNAGAAGIAGIRLFLTA